MRGIIVPAGWDESGRITVTALSTYDENVYPLDTGALDDDLGCFLRKDVEVLGEFVGEGDNRVFAVRSCNRCAGAFETEWTMTDRMILCAQCEKPFPVTDTEAEQLQSRGFDLPRRCPECRRKKWKAANDSGGGRGEDRRKRHRRRPLEEEEWG